MTGDELREYYQLEVRHKYWSKVDELIERVAKELDLKHVIDHIDETGMLPSFPEADRIAAQMMSELPPMKIKKINGT